MNVYKLMNDNSYSENYIIDECNYVKYNDIQNLKINNTMKFNTDITFDYIEEFDINNLNNIDIITNITPNHNCYIKINSNYYSINDIILIPFLGYKSKQKIIFYNKNNTDITLNMTCYKLNKDVRYDIYLKEIITNTNKYYNGFIYKL